MSKRTLDMLKQLVEDSKQNLEKQKEQIQKSEERKQKAKEQQKQQEIRTQLSLYNYDTFNVVINSTTKEYFIFMNEEDRIQKLAKITDFSDEIKQMATMLNVACESCGECYWNKEDNILHHVNIDMDAFVDEYVEYDIVPNFALYKKNNK